MVLRGLIENGRIKPLDPLPDGLCDGSEIEFEVVESVPAVSPQRRAEIDAFFARVNAEGGMDAEDQARFQAVVTEERRLAREYEKGRE